MRVSRLIKVISILIIMPAPALADVTLNPWTSFTIATAPSVGGYATVQNVATGATGGQLTTNVVTSISDTNCPNICDGPGVYETHKYVAAATAAPSGSLIAPSAPYALVQLTSDGTFDNNSIGSRGEAYFTYQFSINGPKSTLIKTDFNFLALAQTGVVANGDTHFGVDGSVDLMYAISVGRRSIDFDLSCGSSFQSECGPNYFVANKSMMLGTNVVYTVYLGVRATTVGTRPENFIGPYFTFVNAYVDPYIAIDPTFSDASEYQLEFSSGITNAPLPAVPEPSINLLLLVGAGILLGRHYAKR